MSNKFRARLFVQSQETVDGTASILDLGEYIFNSRTADEADAAPYDWEWFRRQLPDEALTDSTMEIATIEYLSPGVVIAKHPTSGEVLLIAALGS